jgi:hypothetical protein
MSTTHTKPIPAPPIHISSAILPSVPRDLHARKEMAKNVSLKMHCVDKKLSAWKDKSKINLFGKYPQISKALIS